MTEQLTRILTGLLRGSARLLPPGREQWAEAVRAEAASVPAGWRRAWWLAGGLRLVAREAGMVRKVGYAAGMAAVAAVAAWAVWLSWRVPSSTPASMADRARVLVGVGALVLLPWLGRRRGMFGPVGGSIAARLVRVAACAAMCGLGLLVVQLFGNARGNYSGVGRFSQPGEMIGLALLGAAIAAPLIVPAWWPRVEAPAVWSFAAMAAVAAFIVIPLQTLTVAYMAGILAATARRSPVTPAILAAGVGTGLASGLLVRGMLAVPWNWNLPGFLAVAALLTAAPAGVAAAWLRPGDENQPDPRAARIRHGTLLGTVAGAVCGLLLTLWLPGLIFMMVLGPLAGLAGGLLGAAIAADHPREPRPGRSRYAGLFVLKS